MPAGTEVGAGTEVELLDPNIFWADLGSPIPGRHIPFNGAWPAAWNKFFDTVNGLMATLRSPEVNVPGDKHAVVGTVPGDGDGVALAFDARPVEAKFADLIANLEERVVAAAAANPAASPPTPAYPEAKVMSIRQGRKRKFMLGFEGMALAGGLFAADTLIRGVAYKCSNTGNAEDLFRKRGLDGIFHRSVTLEALPTTVTLAHAQDSGFTVADIKGDDRFIYYRITEAV